jgi:1,2-dihydroxy-3-keto-5-methylthiopentene dioxygenase
MRAYYFDNLPGDQRLPHDYIPSRPASEEVLSKLGVKTWHIPVHGHEPKLDEVARTQGYKNRDTINVSKAGLGEVNMPCLVHLDTTTEPRHW